MATYAKLLAVAKGEVGYVEKKSNKSLDSKKANRGYNNYTKYNRDMKKIRGAGTINDYWCANFVSWCFAKAYGKTEGAKLMYGYGNYVPYIYNHFKANGRTAKSPKKGDVIFFRNLSHIGIVYKVANGYVYTYEGNTSSGAFNANGGAVCKKKYVVGSSWIYGYGRPKWTVPVSQYPTLKKGSKGAYVKKLKTILTKLGYKGMDLKSQTFGNGTKKAVIKFQKDNKLKGDGVVGTKTWKLIAKKWKAYKAKKKKK